MRGADRERLRQALAHAKPRSDADTGSRTAESRDSAGTVLDCDAVAIARPDGVALTVALGVGSPDSVAVRSTGTDSVADSKPFSITAPCLSAMLDVWRRKLF